MVDETGDVKKGAEVVGVKRQYSGTVTAPAPSEANRKPVSLDAGLPDDHGQPGPARRRCALTSFSMNIHGGGTTLMIAGSR